MSNLTGNIIGYDPGGNDKHGLAILHVEDAVPKTLETHALEDAESVIRKMEDTSNLIGAGIDTMTCWSTGKSGKRPADRWLEKNYEEVNNSVVAPNGMYGSMGINGMSLLIEARKSQKYIFVTETHPKVLYYALFDEKYDYDNKSARMDTQLQKRFSDEIDVGTEDDHEWDAAVSTLAVLRGMQDEWTHDLHKAERDPDERLVEPAGKTHYVWPE